MAILPMQSGSSDTKPDNRKVALLKSLSTNNRFYALVHPESGVKNADTIECFPDDMVLGIAYPCLEDGLNDFAVIRSTFETLDQFPDDEELRTELMDIIADAQSKLTRRLVELRDCISSGQAQFLGTDLREFQSYITNLATKGVPRKTLDSMMKLDVFESVATTEALLQGSFAPEFVYIYEFLPANALPVISQLTPRAFVGRLFEDLLTSVLDPSNYTEKHVFDRNVFQKFIAIMFVNYATTDPVFYGTNKADYGVSADKEMCDTPLYRAVAQALRELEVMREAERNGIEFQAAGTGQPEAAGSSESPAAERMAELPSLPVADQQLVERMTPIYEAARMLLSLNNPRAQECGAIILKSTHQLFTELQGMGVLSPAVESPVGQEFRD